MMRYEGLRTHHNATRGTRRRSQIHGVLVGQGKVEVGAGEAAKGADQCQEDDEEDDISAEGADHEDEAD